MQTVLNLRNFQILFLDPQYLSKSQIIQNSLIHFKIIRMILFICNFLIKYFIFHQPLPLNTLASMTQNFQEIREQAISTSNVITFLGIKIGSSYIGFMFTFAILNTFSILLEFELQKKALYYQLYCIIFLQITTVIFMIITTLTDPGRIPQNIQGFQIVTDNFDIPISRKQQNCIMTTRNMIPIIKFCVECRIYRPPRTIHCGQCNNCIQMYDHHCPWIGTCIGTRNYNYFLIFVFLATALTVASMIISLKEFISMTFKNTFQRILSDNIILFVVIIISIWFFLATASLFTYHIRLVMLGITTNEDLKNLYKGIGNGNPYGNFSNIKTRFVNSIYSEKYFRKKLDRQETSINQGRLIEFEVLSSSRSNTIDESLLGSSNAKDVKIQ